MSGEINRLRSWILNKAAVHMQVLRLKKWTATFSGRRDYIYLLPFRNRPSQADFFIDVEFFEIFNKLISQ